MKTVEEIERWMEWDYAVAMQDAAEKRERTWINIQAFAKRADFERLIGSDA